MSSDTGHLSKNKYLTDLYKTAVIAVTLIVGYLLMQAILGSGISHASSAVLASYTSAMHRIGWLTLVLVLLIETGVRMKGGSKKDTIFHLHGLFVAIYTITLLVLLFWFNGYTAPYHDWIGYLCVIDYICLACVGIPMTLSRF